MSGRLSWLWTALLAVVTLPPTILHESVHALVAAPRARAVGIQIGPGLEAAAVIEWRAEPGLVDPAARLAPHALGMAIGAVALWLGWRTGWQPPEDLVMQMATFAIAGWWLIFTAPLADLTHGGDTDA